MLFVVISAFTLYEKSDGVCYSCDDEINDFITCNLSFIEDMDRSTAARYEKETMRAIFRAWDDEKKVTVWQDKLKQDAEHFDGERKQFILNSTQQNNQKDEAIKLFGKEMAGNIFANLKTLDEQGVDLLAYQPPPGGGAPGGTQGEHGGWGNGGDPPDDIGQGGAGDPALQGDSPENCECSTTDNWCPGLCMDSYVPCDITSWGCGWWFAGSCDGICF